MDLLRVRFAHSDDCAVLRHRARQALGPWQAPDLVADSLLVITELVENVIQHTTDGGELVLRRNGDALRIEVTDSSRRLPHVLGPDPRRLGGRGLLLVAAMTHAWGCHPVSDGKVVWADIAIPR
ncbi:anti-sigma regulatory factor (Ser/Thr protein kinase) [Catenuloplanes nepalensis]|uniref:Anti-sigma regulatory factor (Ser/Thr protein kinase) n=1 Tax=Catenuloplanes nepalensis TaxID=587533 RepID=A0ABT9MRX3_9ACTN|nr:ATP-binding protein [Catenuloplanes nepalensis]MDP9794180.1 anti-sigma regulatory factor (Ser/Thr protein kinase) [Catenuloplanes nepalensis]